MADCQQLATNFQLDRISSGQVSLDACDDVLRMDRRVR